MRNSPSPTRRSFLNVAVVLLLVSASVAVIVPSATATHNATGNAPDLISAYFLDADKNGRFDQVAVVFAADLTAGDHNVDRERVPLAATLRPTDFRVDGHVVLGCTPVTGHACVSSGDLDKNAATPEYILVIDESLDYKTGGALPAVSYKRGTLTDTEGDFMADDSDVAEFDGASPIFTAAYARSGDGTVIAHFTETIANLNVAGSVLGGGDSALNAGDVCYTDKGGTTQVVASASASGSTFTITMGSSGTGHASTLQSQDINQPATIGFGDKDGAGCNNAAVQDAAGNKVAAGPIRPISDIQAPFIAGAYGNPGTSELLVMFNGPVTKVGGGGLVVGDLQYINNAAGGATGIAAVQHTAGSNMVRLTLAGVLVKDEMAAGGDQIRIQAGIVAALGDADNINGAQAVTLDRNKPVTGDYAPMTHNRLVPRATGAFTIDQDVDGAIDAILVLFSENILDVDDSWAVHTISGNARTAVALEAVGTEAKLATGASCGGGALPDVPRAVYVCIQEDAAVLGTGATPVISYGGSTLADHGDTFVRPFANLPVADSAKATVLQYKTLDRNGNGQVDAIELLFSEAIDDSSFVASEWTVIDPVNTDSTLASPFKGKFGDGDDVAFTVTGAATGATANDAILLLELTERGTPDTGMLPGIKFTRSSGLKDVSGVAVASFDTTDGKAKQIPGDMDDDEATEPHIVDGARPVLVRTGGTVGSRSLIMTFSEPVSNPSGAKLAAGDLVYNNINQAGASGFDGGIDHVALTAVATATLNADLTSSDFSSDTVTVNADRVVESAATKYVAFTNGRTLTAADTTPASAAQVTKPFASVSNPTISSAVTIDSNADGLIDGIRITFDRDMDDGASCANLDSSTWTVRFGGVAIKAADLALHTHLKTASAPDCSTAPAADRHDAKVFLAWTPGTDYKWPTDATPTISYAGQGGVSFLRAKAGGEPLQPLSNRATTDGAAPVLLTASGSADDNVLTLTFSEGVRGSAAGGKIRFQDLRYSDVNAGGASAFNTVTQHTPGTATVTVTLNQKLAMADIGFDAVRPTATVVDNVGLVALPQNSFVSIQDLTGPRLVTLETMDLNGNGWLDTIKVTFNEPLSDGTACANLAGSPWAVKLGTETLAISKIVTNQAAASGSASCSSGSAGVDDNVIFLVLTEKDEAHTGVRPTVAYAAATTGASVQDSYGNKLGTIGAIMATDKAAPVLLGAGSKAGDPAAAPQANTRDLDGDGKLDAYSIRVSEPVKDSSFAAAAWAVGNAVSGSTHGNLALATGTVANDGNFEIRFAQGSAADTGETPTLAYNPTTSTATPPVSTFLVDMNDNKLAALTSIQGVDQAAPTVVSVASAVDSTTVTVTFSEPVCATDPCAAVGSGGLASGAFAYTNGNSAGAGGLASVAHTDQAKVATLTLDEKATASDREADLISAQPGRIIDANGNLATFASVNLKGQAPDTIPPGQITNLVAVAGAQKVKLTWTTPSASDVKTLDIRISTSDIDSDAKFISAASIDAGTIGTATPIPAATPGGSQTVTVAGLTAGTTYYFAIRATDEAGNQGLRSASASASALEPDTTPPATINDLTFVSSTGNAITVGWTPVGDDGAAGSVASYEVKVSTTAITDETTFNAASNAAVTFDPTALLPGGGTTKQQATITGLGTTVLAPNTAYFVAVRGVDDEGLKGGIASVSGTTQDVDLTAPTGAIVITSSTHPSNSGVTNNDPTFSWSGLSDAESTVTYHWILNKVPSTVVTDATTGPHSGSGVGTTASFADIPAGTWIFHVAGVSQGGTSATASYTILILDPAAPTITPAFMGTSNEALQGSVKVARSGSDNVITWTMPAGLAHDPVGVQIWKSESPFVLLATLPATSSDFQDASFTDAGAAKSAKYVVTAYFLDDASGGKTADLFDVPGYTGLTEDDIFARGAVAPVQNSRDAPDEGLSAMAKGLIAGGVMLVVLVIVLGAIWLVQRKRD